MESVVPSRRHLLAVAAAHWATSCGLSPGDPPKACPLARTPEAETYGWYRKGALELTTCPITELDILCNTGPMIAMEAWSRTTKARLVLVVPRDLSARTEDLLKLRSAVKNDDLPVLVQAVDIKPPELDTLVKLLAAVLPPDALTDAVIFGSAAIQLHGLPKVASDLDVFVSSAVFESCAQSKDFARERKGPGIERLRLRVCASVEIFADFPGVTHGDVLKEAEPTAGSAGLLVASLDSIVTWKSAHARPKDLDDIDMISRERLGRRDP